MEELNKRKRVYDNLKVIGGLMLTMAVISFLFFAKYSNLTSFLFMAVFGISGGILFYKTNKEIKKISIEFKDRFIRKEIIRLLPNSNYNPTKGISSSEVEKSNLIKLHDLYNSEDLIQGIYKDVAFMFSDVHVIDIRSNGKTTTKVTTFRGRFYKFKFNKLFKSNIFLLQPGQYRPFSDYEKIKMESIHFNSEFKVYTDNEQDAFYILTPHFMERLLKLDRMYNDKIGFSFLNNHLYIAVDSRTDSFDVLQSGDITVKHVEEAVNELNLLTDFVDFLQLEKSIFKTY